jgi:NAD(P)-dependent dehydrogenase (short-subunit alcohol dehydrogenase family)
MKNILIIGASGGIGNALASILGDQGHVVYGTYHRDDWDPGSEKIHHHRLDVLGEHLDLGFLPDSLDGLVYCPGSINLKPFSRFTPEDFLEDYRLQVVGAVRVIQGSIKRLRASASPSVVLFSTVAVQQGFRFHTQVAASKGAIEGLTRSLAAEYAPKIRFNCIAPSLTDTPLAAGLLNTDEKRSANADRHPLKRVGEPEDLASLAAFLLTGKSGWITGQVFPVDGGMSVIKA